MSHCCCQTNCLCLSVPAKIDDTPIVPAKSPSLSLSISLPGLRLPIIPPYTGVLPTLSQLPKLPLYPPTVVRPQNWNHPGRVGLHVGLHKTLLETVQQAGTVGARCCQIYLGNKTSYGVRDLSPLEQSATQQYLLDHQSSLYIHAPLIVNLGGQIGGNSLNKSMEVLVKELQAVHDLPASVVVHMGKGNHGCTIEQMGQVVNHLNLTKGYYPSNPYRLLLENDAGQGTSLVRSVDDMRKLYEVLDRTVIGLCLDTQHCFAGGQVHWSDHDTISYLEAVASAVGRDQIGLIHLNDSDTAFGSHHDVHANLGQGHIWSRDNTGFCRLMDWVNQTDTDVILETNNGYAEAAHLNRMLLK